MLSHRQLLNPLCLNMLPLDAHTAKAPTALIFITFTRIRQPSMLFQAYLLGWKQNYLSAKDPWHK